MKVIVFLILLIWLLSSLYFGIGGFVKEDYYAIKQEINPDPSDTIPVPYKGIVYASIKDANRAMERDSVSRFFPLVFTMPNFLVEIITACSFGLLGVIIQMLRQIVGGMKTIDQLRFISLPLLGILTAFVVWGITYLLPSVLTAEGGELRPSTIMFLSLFAGLYSEKFYEKITTSMSSLFKQ